ncbi:haloacid dehalogenase type II [Aquimarina algiphila]|uniref:haloacid dehalogenase type II n=1 Tax=Aquimarina algiphila TaxID=2047982 RepID=UPI00232ED5BA|nr:haloacid dehalogenase type II [Aquimarina algiphila]
MTTYTLAFDVYGTLIDTSGIFHSLEKMVGKATKVFMNTWRLKQLEYSFRRGLMDDYVDFSICTREALEYTCLDLDIKLTLNQKISLMKEYTTLPIFPDVLDGLQLLKETGYKVYAFSNGSSLAIKNLIDTAQIATFFDGIVSVEATKTFKPSPVVYRHFNTQTNSTPDNSWLISSNSFDVIGAISYGMRSVWVQRSSTSIFDPWNISPTATITSIKDLNKVLKNTE